MAENPGGFGVVLGQVYRGVFTGFGARGSRVFCSFFYFFKVLPLLKIKKNTFFKAGFLLLPLFVFLGILLCESIKRFYM